MIFQSRELLLQGLGARSVLAGLPGRKLLGEKRFRVSSILLGSAQSVRQTVQLGRQVPDDLDRGLFLIRKGAEILALKRCQFCILLIEPLLGLLKLSLNKICGSFGSPLTKPQIFLNKHGGDFRTDRLRKAGRIRRETDLKSWNLVALLAGRIKRIGERNWLHNNRLAHPFNQGLNRDVVNIVFIEAVSPDNRLQPASAYHLLLHRRQARHKIVSHHGRDNAGWHLRLLNQDQTCGCVARRKLLGDEISSDWT